MDLNPYTMDPNLPLKPPPPGISSNFDDPDLSNQRQLVAAVAISLALALFLLLTRLYTRIFLVGSVGSDDCMSCEACSAPSRSS